MYHSNGNYEAFMDARKPEGAEKRAHISLAAVLPDLQQQFS